MQIEHKIGQLLFISLPTTHIDQATRELLEQIQPGGVLLDKNNIQTAQQVLELTSQIRSIVKVPPLIAVDQEGGRVDRLKDIYAPMPSADLFRSVGDAASSSQHGQIDAEALRLLGFNMNFSPVLDIATDDTADNGLQGRYLGGAPGHVIALAGTYLEGLQSNGVIGVGKHFPGLGATTVDSHKVLPQISLSREELKERDLLPYLELFSKINSRLVAVMVSHAHYTAYDGTSALPASISKNVINGLLRDELGFRGLVITDDLGMGAITTTRSSGEAAIMAIEAGVDMTLVCSSPEQTLAVWQTMVEAANRGRITRTHISRAFDHIARIKAMVSPPHAFHEETILRLRDAIEELNVSLHNRTKQ